MTRMSRRILVATIAGLLTVVAARVAPAVEYTITDLNVAGDSSNFANGINNHGDVAGTANIDGHEHAWVYHAGARTDLGALAGGSDAGATDINDGGQVTGQARTAAGQTHAMLYSGGVMNDLGALPGAYASIGQAVNSSGQIAGWSNFIASDGTPYSHAFLYSGGALQDLGTLDVPDSLAWDLNDAGQVVGRSSDNHAFTHAFLYSAGTMHDLGTFGYAFSGAAGINSSGQVAGSLSGALTGVAVIFDHGTALPLGPGNATKINAAGQVILNSGMAGHPFLYSGGVAVDLNTLLPAGSGWILDQANDINDLGQIVGTGTFEGKQHSFLLSPVPEPATLSLVAAGIAAGLAARCWSALRPCRTPHPL